MADIRNATEVQLTVTPTGDSQYSISGAARVAVQNFSFTVEPDNQEVHGVGSKHAKGTTEGNISKSVSWTAQGEDGDMLGAVLTRNGESRQFAFVAHTDDYVVECSEAKLTSASYSGDSGQAVEWAFEAVAVKYEQRPK